MGTTWHRDVKVATNGEGEYLEVKIPKDGNPPGRNDTASHIDVLKGDRADGPAKVIYTLAPDLTGQLTCVPKNTKLPPHGIKVKEHKHGLTINDKITAGAKPFTYYLELNGIRTPDPMIHNPGTGEDN